MPTKSRQKSRIILVLPLLAAAVGGYVMFADRAASSPVPELTDVLVTESDGFRYEFHVASGREGLFVAGPGGKSLVNVIHEHGDVALKCRGALEREFGVANLETLRSRYGAQNQRLRALGYL